MDTFIQDLRYSLRSMRNRPAFAVVAALTLALGVGANTAMFSVVNAVLLRPLPYEHPDRLVMVWAKTEGAPRSAASFPEFMDWRDQAGSFEALAVWRGQSVNLTGAGEPERLIGAFVTAALFPILGVQPAVGRLFRPEETELATVAPVALLSHGLWQRRFGADPAIVGKPLTLNGRTVTVVGILDPSFGPGRAPADGWFMSTEVWLPAAYFPNQKGLERGQGEMLVVGRLKPGVTAAQAQADVGVVARRLEQAYPDTQAGRSVEVVSFHEQIVGDSRTILMLLMGVVGLVLLIACANTANLLLARAAQRQDEMAVRSALGAGRARLVRQLLTESVVVAVLAGAMGLLVGYWALQGLLAILPAGTPVPADTHLDRTVFLYTLGLSFLTGILFGMVPALHASRPNLTDILREGGQRGGRGAGRRRLTELLVVSEAALALVLLVGAGLLLQSTLALQRTSPGFRPDHLLTLEFRLPPSKYPEPRQIASFFREILEHMRAIPGVETAALVRATPFSGNGAQDAYRAEGRPEEPPAQQPRAETNIVSPDYFRTMGIPILQGRVFNDHDTLEAPPAVVVNATLARLVWPGEAAIGKRLHLKSKDQPTTVIGVVGDVKHADLTAPPRAQVYTSHDQDPKIFAGVVVRTAGAPMAIAPAVRSAIWSVDKDQPVWKALPMEALIERSRGPVRTTALLVLVFAAVAAVLAAIGIYGVTAYAVAQRTREIGIRMALGAPAGNVVSMVVGRGLVLTATAIVLGLGGAAALSRLMGSLLVGVGPMDPLSFAGASLLLAAVSLMAAYLPARRAARVDPVVALTAE